MVAVNHRCRIPSNQRQDRQDSRETPTSASAICEERLLESVGKKASVDSKDPARSHPVICLHLPKIIQRRLHRAKQSWGPLPLGAAAAVLCFLAHRSKDDDVTMNALPELSIHRGLPLLAAILFSCSPQSPYAFRKTGQKKENSGRPYGPPKKMGCSASAVCATPRDRPGVIPFLFCVCEEERRNAPSFWVSRKG